MRRWVRRGHGRGKGHKCRRNSHSSRSRRPQQPQEQAVAVDTSQTDGAVDALDAVLDDIESVLEQNAQEYVNSFVQKGGE